MKKKKISRREFVETSVATTLGVTGGLVIPKTAAGAAETVLVGQGKQMTTILQQVWEEGISHAPQAVEAELRFMSEEHHLVRNFVVRALPSAETSMRPELIARRTGLSVPRVQAILDDLEEHLTFLFRDDEGAVEWAYPVTISRTPHHVKFSTGEDIYAA